MDKCQRVRYLVGYIIVIIFFYMNGKLQNILHITKCTHVVNVYMTQCACVLARTHACACVFACQEAISGGKRNIYIYYKEDLGLYNYQGLICHELEKPNLRSSLGF